LRDSHLFFLSPRKGRFEEFFLPISPSLWKEDLRNSYLYPPPPSGRGRCRRERVL